MAIPGVYPAISIALAKKRRFHVDDLESRQLGGARCLPAPLCDQA
jgi:hypothetical protein